MLRARTYGAQAAAGEMIARLLRLGERRIVALWRQLGMWDALAAKLGLDEAVGGMLPQLAGLGVFLVGPVRSRTCVEP